MKFYLTALIGIFLGLFWTSSFEIYQMNLNHLSSGSLLMWYPWPAYFSVAVFWFFLEAPKAKKTTPGFLLAPLSQQISQLKDQFTSSASFLVPWLALAPFIGANFGYLVLGWITVTQFSLMLTIQITLSWVIWRYLETVGVLGSWIYWALSCTIWFLCGQIPAWFLASPWSIGFNHYLAWLLALPVWWLAVKLLSTFSWTNMTVFKFKK